MIIERIRDTVYRERNHIKLQRELCEYIAYLAQKSILYEVSATPKPGLVDRNNSGAHNDMDFYTFMSSSATLYNGFYHCALEGITFEGTVPRELFNRIRPIGIEMERGMLKATGGVNTHKGIIFSIGIISAAAGNLCRNYNSIHLEAEKVCDYVAKMTKGITLNELGDLSNKDQLTNGERLYLKYGITGIRGEVESGFRTVREKSLNLFRKMRQDKKIDLNDMLVQILINIMTICEDSNIVSRHSIETLNYVQSFAEEIISLGGIFTENGKAKIEEMDRNFIDKNISPGGSADLLAVTVMLGMLEEIEE